MGGSRVLSKAPRTYWLRPIGFTIGAYLIYPADTGPDGQSWLGCLRPRSTPKAWIWRNAAAWLMTMEIPWAGFDSARLDQPFASRSVHSRATACTNAVSSLTARVRDALKESASTTCLTKSVILGDPSCKQPALDFTLRHS